MAKNQTPDPFVTVITNGKTKIWNREEAIQHYATGVLQTDGSEMERYAIALADLCLGANEIYDDDD